MDYFIKEMNLEDFFEYRQEVIDIGIISITWRDFQEKYRIKFNEDCDELDSFKYAVILLENGSIYLLWAYQNYQQKEPNNLTIKLQANVEMPLSKFQEFLELLDIDRDCVEWENDGYKKNKRFRVWRKAESGIEEVIANYFVEEDAKRASDYLSKKNTEYKYWVESFLNNKAR